jgi:exosortase
MKSFFSLLSQLWHDLRMSYLKFPYAFLLLVAVLLYSGWQILFFTTAKDNAVPLWLLAVIISWRTISGLRIINRTDTPARISAWILLALVPLCLQIPSISGLHFNTMLSVFLVAMAVIAYSNGRYAVFRFVPVLVLTLLVIPVQEQLFLALSYPLRLISTILTVGTLRLFGVDISHQLTTIRLASCDIAITDACSGIAQMAVLVLLGYIIVIMKHHRTYCYAILHYAALVPIVIFANSVRLVLTILLFYIIGKDAFSNVYHASFGFLFVIFATALFYWTGALFPEKVFEASLSESAVKPDEEN